MGARRLFALLVGFALLLTQTVPLLTNHVAPAYAQGMEGGDSAPGGNTGGTSDGNAGNTGTSGGDKGGPIGPNGFEGGD